jgi:hypothetical protein
MDAATLRDVSNFILWAGLVAAACGTFGINYFRTRVERDRERTSATTQEQSARHASDLQAKVDELLRGNEAVVSQNKQLLSDIQGYQRDLRGRDERIRELEAAAKAAKRGVVKRYDFNGGKRTQSGGGSNVVVGAEFNVFQKMVALERSKDFSELIRLAEAQIAQTPEWLTPYYFLGIAFANTNQRDKAIRNLQRVVDEAGGDPEYSGAAELLGRIRRLP